MRAFGKFLTRGVSWWSRLPTLFLPNAINEMPRAAVGQAPDFDWTFWWLLNTMRATVNQIEFAAQTYFC